MIKGFVEREKLSTTGMEQGIAIPHTELESINKASIVILKLNQGVDWKALDGQPTNIVIAMFIPKGKANDHLRYYQKSRSFSFTKNLSTNYNMPTVLKKSINCLSKTYIKGRTKP